MTPFSLPSLPYSENALEPHISRETLEYHYGKHLATYFTNLSGLVENTSLATISLEEVVRTAPKWPIFNNAAQAWNHVFYFESFTSAQSQVLLSDNSALTKAIQAKWGDFANFQKSFNDIALKTFGSGWTWLVKKPSGELDIISTSNAETPLTTEDIPLLVCDVWEHAYYIDYRNARAKYLENFWPIVDWKKIEERFSEAKV